MPDLEKVVSHKAHNLFFDQNKECRSNTIRASNRAVRSPFGFTFYLFSN